MIEFQKLFIIQKQLEIFSPWHTNLEEKLQMKTKNHKTVILSGTEC